MMKKFLIGCLLLFFASRASAANPVLDSGIYLIPEPVSLHRNAGQFLITPETKILISAADKSHIGIAQYLVTRLHISTGYDMQVTSKKQSNAVIRLELNKVASVRLGKEGYTLHVTPQQVLITANQPEGWFYAIQSLLQLLPADVESQQKVRQQSWSVPCVSIMDYPRFEWRGLMLDVSRHFFSKEVVMAYIEQMAKYKFNSLHLHLTDDQGWRIEINGLPKLTKVGAWRVPREGYWGNNFEKPQSGELATYGGYYSRKDIQDLVAYAAARYITILPEIDVPAHSLALIASYPELSCRQLQYPVNPGIPWSNEQENVLCAGNDSVFLVLDKIFTEVAQLFPGEYIHVGGDEAVKTFWERCPKCQKRMKEEGLQNAAELQSYFIKRVAKIVKSKGKKLIGWDEILEGGLAADATVMSWRGMEGGIKAASMGHNVIMSPWQHAYIDLYQGDPLLENGPGAICRLTSCYQFEPVPEGINEKRVLGGQGNLWTEYVPNERQVQFMTWPRGMALAEVFWTQKQKRDLEDFILRMEQHFPRLDSARVKYSIYAYDPIISATKSSNGETRLTIDSEVRGLDIYYTFDDTSPDCFYSKYKGVGLAIPKGARRIRAVAYRDGKPLSREVRFLIADLEKRIKN